MTDWKTMEIIPKNKPVRPVPAGIPTSKPKNNGLGWTTEELIEFYRNGFQ